MKPCMKCLASGQVTFDEFKISYPDVIREVKNDMKKHGTSRTKDALNNGSLKFSDCETCNGEGLVPR